MIDWNWYFAAYAQCGAALIGILAAFVISKLLGENERYRELDIKLNTLNIKRKALKEKVSNCRLRWCDQQTIKYGIDIGKAIKNRHFDELSEEKKIEELFKIDPSLYRSKNCIKYLEERIAKIAVDPTSEPEIPHNINEILAQERKILLDLRVDADVIVSEFYAISSRMQFIANNLD